MPGLYHGDQLKSIALEKSRLSKIFKELALSLVLILAIKFYNIDSIIPKINVDVFSMM